VRTVAADGGAVVAALAERYGVAAKTAEQLLRRTRELHDLPVLKRGPRGMARGPIPLARVAEVARAATAAGEPVLPALRAEFGLPDSTLKNWFARVRADGILVEQPVAPVACSGPAPKPAASPVDERIPSFRDLDADVLDEPQDPETLGLTWEEVRDAYLDAEDACRMPVQAVADRFGVPRAWANMWVRRCRELGLLPARDVPQRDRVAPAPRAVPRSGAY
jgi:transposase